MLRVVDADGQILAYVLYEDEPIRHEPMKRLTKDEARRIAANIAKLPELLGTSKASRAGDATEVGGQRKTPELGRIAVRCAGRQP